uniref:Uncharacterized protein n=1 Tax=Lactuca sativa TaxID=4236 RepID=A0A9R1UXR3_LACSA|nr:hypothetical protein LSAT_V11C700348770 [Lactuca sativa]
MTSKSGVICKMSFIILCMGGSWQLVNGDEVYVRNNVKIYGLNLPPNIDHEMLLQMVRNNDKEEKVGMTELQRQNLFKFREVPEIDDRRCEEK